MFLVSFLINLATILVNMVIVVANLTKCPNKFNQAMRLGGLLTRNSW